MAMRNPLPRMNRRGRWVLGLLVGLIALLTATGWMVGIWTDYLWYDEVGFTKVFSTTLRTRAVLFAVFGLAMASWVVLNLWLAHRFRRPAAQLSSPDQQVLDRYRRALSPRLRLWTILLGAVVGLFTGLAAQDHWQDWLLFSNAQDVGVTDPQFGKDIGFYLFDYPFWTYLLSVAFTATVIALIGALGAHYLYGSIRLSGRGERITTAARIHISSLIALFVLLKAVAYWMDRYGLVIAENDVTGLTGGGYTEMNALLFAKEILIFVAIIGAVAVVLFSNGFGKTMLWPACAIGLVVVSAIAIGGIYPYAVKSISVAPNVPAKEGRYVQWSIDATRDAYGMDGVQPVDSGVTANGDATALGTDKLTVPNVRLLDPSIVADIFSQKQQARGFHGFPDKLDVDRYKTADGELRDYIVGVRELSPDKYSEQQKNWTIRHTELTHGYGFVAAPANQICGEGEPYFVSGFLNTDQVAANCRSAAEEIKVDRPQIYYGELMTDYAVVGVPDGAQPKEFDHPSASGDAKTTYAGSGGVEMDSLWNRMLYAWEFRETKFLLSEEFNENSKLLYVRNPMDRVAKVAPFLTLDGDPYPAVVDGKVVWILDGYTTSATYPYSDKVDLESASKDTLTGTGTTAQAGREVNYVRNSVKATVDAYDGTVSLYSWDDADPVLKAWNAAFGGIVKPKAEIPKSLADHFRYPEDLFKIQRDLLQRFHVTDAATFIGGNQAWETPVDPAKPDGKQPPYYVVANYPGQTGAQFQLTSTMSPRTRGSVTSGLLSAYYDAENKPKLQLYTVKEELSSSLQTHQNLTSLPEVVSDLRLFETNKTTVEYGNMLALPVGNGVLYVEPLYLRQQAAGTNGVSLPQMRKVLVAYGKFNAYADTLPDALQSIIKQYTTGTGTPPPTTDPGTTPPPTTTNPGKDDPAVTAAVEKMNKAIEDLRTAQKNGDFKAQGEALAALDAAIKEYDAAVKAAGG
ncbi:UPF0182 protein [Actinorhabdospora filicis]|uniref:UPF0182 protein n=2 Tax=Actinorhabdospora filicis TaxID=1785913 RepID=A0A9W6SU52_9ACTN|nr:UPF0182 protein [Actinorhabdospora filicis]